MKPVIIKGACAYTEADVETESSVCTGEKLIGFRNPKTKKLEQAVVVRGSKDIADFYRSHGLKQPPHEGK